MWPLLYSDPVLIASVLPIRTSPRDSWMWPCSASSGCTSSMICRTAVDPTGIGLRLAADVAQRQVGVRSRSRCRAPSRTGGTCRLKIADSGSLELVGERRAARRRARPRRARAGCPTASGWRSRTRSSRAARPARRARRRPGRALAASSTASQLITGRRCPASRRRRCRARAMRSSASAIQRRSSPTITSLEDGRARAPGRRAAARSRRRLGEPRVHAVEADRLQQLLELLGRRAPRGSRR